jgi:diguanylate cyclase (GGDEF)-like protein
VAGILRDFSPDIAVCRLGGDEFMLLAHGWNSADAEKRLEELRARLINFNGAPGAFYSHSVSYGVVEVGGDNEKSAGDLLALADEKMYLYKKSHRAERRNNLV